MFKVLSSKYDVGTMVYYENQKYANVGIKVNYKKKEILYIDDLVKDVTQDFINLSSLNENSKMNMTKNGNSIFIVHGHDHTKVTELENFVRNIGYEPIVLFKETDTGETIIEKIEKYSNQAIYAIVLYTKCDEGYPAGKDSQKKPRARQNVVFEHGYLMAKLGRNRVCAILSDDSIETPGDISGIIYKLFDENSAWKYQIAKSMKEVGINIDLNKIK